MVSLLKKLILRIFRDLHLNRAVCVVMGRGRNIFILSVCIFNGFNLYIRYNIIINVCVPTK